MHPLRRLLNAFLVVPAVATALSSVAVPQASTATDEVAGISLPAPRGPGAIEETRVAEVLGFLSSDALAGRDSPSPGLTAAQEYLRRCFAAADLVPGAGQSWFHEYEVDGQRVDSAAVTFRFERDGRTFTLAGGADLRVVTPGRAIDGQTTVRVTTLAELGGRRGPRGDRRPTLVVVPADHPMWLASPPGVTERMVRGRLRNSPPVILARAEALDGDWPAEITGVLQAPAGEATKLTLRNVVGLLPGTDLAGEYVLVSAHNDHVGINPAAGDDIVFNGADDNATGSAALVLLAEAMAKARPRRSILFVGFSAEEKGLVGSRAMAETPPVPLADIAVNINLEMLGRPPADGRFQAWVTGAPLSDFEAIAKEALATAEVETIRFPMADRLFFASDNAAFARKGVVAHSISAGTLHGDYHRPGDEFDKVDVVHMTRVIRGLRAVVEAFADRDARPEWTEAGQQMIESGGRRR